MKPFHDHFSSRASAYAEFRPSYPASLFAFLAAHAPSRRVAWDCATGSGQAAIPLTEHFERVIATDASSEQIANVTPHARVEYRVARAEESGIAGAPIDLVTVAQAVHWFDLARFWTEVRRVMAPSGVIAVWCYDMFQIDPRIDAILLGYYRTTVGPFWPPERKIIEEGYRRLDFPFRELELPSFAIERELSLDQVAGYLRTWSSTRRFHEARGFDPVEALVDEIAPAWGTSTAPRRVRWPIHARVGIVG